jgi:Hint domain
MSLFEWTSAAGGDWSTRTNWAPLAGAPPGVQDEGIFGSLATSYTVNVTTTVADIAIGIIDPGASGPTFSISGALTAGDIFYLGLSPTTMTVDPGGLLDITSSLEAIGVTETITIAGTGAGGHLVLGNAFTVGVAGSNVTFDFANTSPTALNTGAIQIDGTGRDPGAPTSQTITDVANGDKFVLPDETFAAGDTVTLNTTTHELTVRSGLLPVFTMENIFLEAGAANSFVASGDMIQAVCYARGTMIRTPDGERAVETLSIGDPVLTSDGRVMPVRWIGRNTVSTKFADPLRVLPIRIKAGALADHLPVRDLLVSPEHAVLVDDILIQAGALVNGLSIVRESNVAETFVYYHIELAEHALVLAEGTPAESFVDNIHRMAFDNWEEHEALYGDAPIVEMDHPRARSHRQVPMEIRARLLDRAATMPDLQRGIAA